MLIHRLLADATVVFHAAYVLFVVLGLPVILIGAWRGTRAPLAARLATSLRSVTTTSPS